MSTVAVASAKGSPGATTTALALASWWHRPMIVMEADPAGGDVAARLELAEEPGLVGLAASLRRASARATPDVGWINDHLQETSAGIRVVLAPAGSHQASSALSLLSETHLPSVALGTDLLLDLGRISDQSGTIGKPSPDGRSVRWANRNPLDLFVWICRPQLADLAHLGAALDRRRGDNQQQVIVLSGAGPYPADEVVTTLGVPVLGHLPHDPSGATALWSGGGRTWPRSALGSRVEEPGRCDRSGHQR